MLIERALEVRLALGWRLDARALLTDLRASCVFGKIGMELNVKR
jgi:hypothetical protein